MSQLISDSVKHLEWVRLKHLERQELWNFGQHPTLVKENTLKSFPFLHSQTQVVFKLANKTGKPNTSTFQAPLCWCCVAKTNNSWIFWTKKSSLSITHPRPAFFSSFFPPNILPFDYLVKSNSEKKSKGFWSETKRFRKWIWWI